MKIKFFETYTITDDTERFEKEVNDFMENNEIIDVKQSYIKDRFGESYFIITVLYK
jgi:hypothetical protein